MKNEKRTSIYGVITVIIAVIAVIGIMNYYASGWDKAMGIESSFFATFVGFLVALFILFILFCVGVALWKKTTGKGERR